MFEYNVDQEWCPDLFFCLCTLSIQYYYKGAVGPCGHLSDGSWSGTRLWCWWRIAATLHLFNTEPLMSVYTDNGYADRKEYLDELREEYGDLVDILTGILPSSEDFDGLVTALEDAMDSGEYEDLMWQNKNWHRQAPKTRSGCPKINKSTKRHPTWFAISTTAFNAILRFCRMCAITGSNFATIFSVSVMILKMKHSISQRFATISFMKYDVTV